MGGSMADADLWRVGDDALRISALMARLSMICGDYMSECLRAGQRDPANAAHWLEVASQAETARNTALEELKIMFDQLVRSGQPQG